MPELCSGSPAIYTIHNRLHISPVFSRKCYIFFLQGYAFWLHPGENNQIEITSSVFFCSYLDNLPFCLLEDLLGQIPLKSHKRTQYAGQPLQGHLVECRKLRYKQGVNAKIGIHDSLLLIGHTARLIPLLLILLIVKQLVRALLDQFVGSSQSLRQVAQWLIYQVLKPLLL